ncbi:hypothetical protein HED49_17510 [Ochrobactrum daejeonense]|nr:hypothetical protein [Brucella daejeonensis]
MLVGSNSGTDRTRLARIDLATGEEREVDSHPSDSLDTPARKPIRGILQARS